MKIEKATFLPGANARPKMLPSSLEGVGELDVAMAPRWPPYKNSHPVGQQTQLFINGKRYYYLQQAPDFVIGEHNRLKGEDQKFVGLTVKEAFSKHGRTVSGGVAPNTQKHPRVLGFIADP